MMRRDKDVLEVSAPVLQRTSPPYAVEEVQGLYAFARLADEWDQTLAEGAGDAPFQRHAFLTAWLHAFAPLARLRVLIARDARGRAVGWAPLIERRRAGRVILSAPANDHSCRVDWVLGADAPGAVASLWTYLRDRLRWDLLVLRDLPRDGPTSMFLERHAQRDRHLTGRWESLRTPYLELEGRAEDDGLSAKFVANLRRRQRRLRELGAVSYRAVGRDIRSDDGAAEVELFVERFFALEAAGWKGRRGTALARDSRTRAFYGALARVAYREGWLALRGLELDGRPIAMHFGLLYRGIYSLPKPTYAEPFAACSPGQLLLREVLAEGNAQGWRVLDFLGPDMPWKRDWAPRFRPHDWLYIYRPGWRGGLSHLWKHRVKPFLREKMPWPRT